MELHVLCTCLGVLLLPQDEMLVREGFSLRIVIRGEWCKVTGELL